MPNEMNWKKECLEGAPWNQEGNALLSKISSLLTENRNATVRECVEALPQGNEYVSRDWLDCRVESHTALLALIDKKV